MLEFSDKEFKIITINKLKNLEKKDEQNEGKIKDFINKWNCKKNNYNTGKCIIWYWDITLDRLTLTATEEKMKEVKNESME